MSKTKWKAREREVARAVGGRRYPANTGARIDVESSGHVIQVKERKTLSLAQIEALAVEMERIGAQKSPPKCGSVWLKRSAGRGVATPWLVVVTEAAWRLMNGPTPMENAAPSETRTDENL